MKNAESMFEKKKFFCGGCCVGGCVIPTVSKAHSALPQESATTFHSLNVFYSGVSH